jgi:hypothetical protein
MSTVNPAAPDAEFDLSNLYVEEKEPEKKPTASEKKAEKKIVDSIAEPSPEQRQERKELLVKFNRYAKNARFKDYLKGLGIDLNPNRAHGLELQKLRDLVDEASAAVASKSTNNVFLSSTLTISGMLESVTQHPKFKDTCNLAGFKASIEEDEDLLDAIEALGLEYGGLAMMPLPVKVGYLLLQNGAKVAMFNKIKAARMGILLGIQQQKLREQEEAAQAAAQAAAPPAAVEASTIDAASAL